MFTPDGGWNGSPLSGGIIPTCVDVLIVQGSVRGLGLTQAYTPAKGTLLRNWVASGHGLMIAGEFGNFRAGTEALFQAYGYSQQGAFAVSNPTVLIH